MHRPGTTSHLPAGASHRAAERTLVRYLLLPRPGEAWVKGWLAPIAFGVVTLAGDEPPGPSVAVATVAWLVFELVLYQVRYLVNDLADADVDRAHVAAATRGRLPGDERATRWARASVVPRVVIGLVVIAALPRPARGITLAAAVGLAVATVAYECARNAVRGRSVEVRTVRVSGAEAAVFAFVGAGYALRLGLGAALAGATADLIVAVAGFGWLFGTLVVVMTWTCEAAGLLAGDGAAVLARKSHVAVLARLLGDDPGRWRTPLSSGRPARLVAVVEAVTMALALWVGALLAGRPSTGADAFAAVVCVAVAPVVPTLSPRLWAGWTAAALAAASCLVAGAGVASALVVFCVAGPVAAFRSFTPATLGLAAAAQSAPRHRSARELPTPG